VFKRKETLLQSQDESLATSHLRQTFPLLADALRVRGSAIVTFPMELYMQACIKVFPRHTGHYRPGHHQEVSVDCCRIDLVA